MRQVYWLKRGMALLALIGVGLWPAVGKTAMVKKSVEQLAVEADTIVLGTVSDQVSAWNAEHTAIYTDVTVAVEEVIKGSPGGQVTFRIAGGVVGDIGMRTSNDPEFQNGERVLVFLNTAEVLASLVGLQQGKYTVEEGSVTKGGRAVAVADFVQSIRATLQNQ